jgi:hypothetical protein
VTLKEELDHPQSPLRVFLADRFPHTSAARAPYLEQHEGAPIIGGAAFLAQRALPAAERLPRHPSTEVGHSVSVALTTLLDPDPTPHARPRHRHPLTRQPWALGEAFQAAMTREFPPLLAAVTDPAQVPDRLLRLWVLAGAFDQLYRAGSKPGQLLLQLPPSVGLDEALDALDPLVLEDVRAILAANAEHVMTLRQQGTAAASPVLSGRGLVGDAEPDLLVGSTLVEIKTVVDKGLKLRSLQQLLCYALLDLDDAHHVRNVALWNTRYARLVTWPLSQLLETLHGRPLEIAEARAVLGSALRR